jgi:hypothetical protein
MDLYAVVVHVGDSRGGGHYVTYVKDCRGDWWELSDTSAFKTDAAHVLAQQAYLLFYLREPRERRNGEDGGGEEGGGEEGGGEEGLRGEEGGEKQVGGEKRNGVEAGGHPLSRLDAEEDGLALVGGKRLRSHYARRR